MNKILKLFIFMSFWAFFACSYEDVTIYQESHSLLGNAVVSTKVDSSVFYYYSGRKIFLSEHKDVVLVCFVDESSKLAGVSDLRNQFKFTSWRPEGFTEPIIDDGDSPIAVIKSAIGEFSKEDFLKLKERSDVLYVSYLTECNGHYSAPTNNIFVKIKKESDYRMLEEWVNKLSCTFVDKPYLGENLYLISVPKTNELSAIEVANVLKESGKFVYSSPTFYLFDCFSSNDEYYNLQWGLWDRCVSTQNSSSSVETAWSITEGDSNVIVSVIDTGVELNHPDLQGQLVPGYNAINNVGGGGYIGTSKFSAHGTAVSGIISAKKDNNIGLTGVAPGCKVMPIRVSTDMALDQTSFPSAINWAVDNGASVINLSWGTLERDADFIDDVLTRATTMGRGGKGCVVVAASGNETSSYISYPARHSSVLAVGAHSINGLRCNFSNYGDGLDVVAPGEYIMTTDLLGVSGMNPNNDEEVIDLANVDYTKAFRGTSAAAPFVSGIAALIISKYPDLSQEQVRRAIELGCDRPSGYTYQIDNQTPFGLWNNQVGYGNVNAYSALLKAEDFHQENVANSIPGIDFDIRNESSYTISNIYVGLTGTIDGSYFTFFSSDPGSLDSNQSVGFPTFRGENITDPPGTLITDLELEIYAECPDYSGDLRFSAHIDDFPYIDLLSFDQGNTYYVPIEDTTVPNASRKKLIIHIMDPLN